MAFNQTLSSTPSTASFSDDEFPTSHDLWNTDFK